MSERACASCGTVNEADARFCEGCGTALERTCAACGVAASATARFCRACGAALDARPGSASDGPTRKTVTVLFADLAGSTAFEEIVDAETTREVIGKYHDLLRSTADRHRAGVTKYIGDGFMAVWGVPEIGADDAEHAVEAAIELQERFVGLASQVTEVHGVNLALRVAVNTGEVVVGADDADLVGDALNVGARLESECPHGHVVVGEETWRSTRGRHRYDPLGAVQVKGRTAPVSVYQWSGRSTEASESVAFVGRADELRRIQTVFDDAVDNTAARLITIIGDPGVGKSRLAAEFISAHSDARIVRANCAVEGTPALTPIVELLRSRDIEADVPVGTPERERIVRALTGMAAGVAGSVEETFWALRRFAEILAAERPLIIVFDDIHWADSLLLDFIEHLAEWARGVQVLMIALARPELRETRPELVTVGGCVTEAVRLSGLEPSATAELAAQVLGSEQLPVELLSRLPSSTGGNPLFVRELVGMLVHDGVLVPRPDGWRLTVDVDAIAIPPTIQALLASRLERLNAADRRVLEVASVVGTDFSPAAVCALTGLGRADTKFALDRLRRHDLAQPTGTYSGDEPVWRFHHVLIRDVAYRRLLKSDRAELHERLADWAPGDGARPALESDEMVARHLEAAFGYRRDLGLRDEHTADLALRSAQGYLASARRALDRDELLSAGTQAARGAAIAGGDATLQAELLLIGCEAFLSAGDVAAGAPLVDELEHVAGESLAPWAICYRCQLIAYTDPSRLLEADERLQGAIDEFGRRKDAAGLAKAHRVRASARGRLGRIGDSEIDLFEALIAARQCGDHRQITAALGAAPNAALWGPSPAPKAGGRCLDVVRMQRMTTAAPSLEATSLRCLAVLELLRGRAEKARTMLADARQVVADLGLRHGLMETELFAGIIELMVGDPVSAEPHFRTALEGLDALGVGADAGQAAALLARSVLAQGRIDEADRYAAQSERIAGHNLKTAIAWRAVRAEILSAQVRHEAAVALAHEAVAVAADTDLVLDHADACMALSRVLAAAGDERAAAEARRNAESLYAAKDAAFMVERTVGAVQSASTQPPAEVTTSRLAVHSRAGAIVEAGWRAMQAHDVDTAVATFSERFVYDDHRRLGGDPIEGIDNLRAAVLRHYGQYSRLEWRPLAVRGESLQLIFSRWRDDDGNETTSFDLLQIGDDDLIAYHGRFDEDDFAGAYRELERRYYTGEGAPFAENGRSAACAWIEAMWQRDVEAARRVAWPDFRWLASPSALKPAARSVDELFAWLDERAQQVGSMRLWAATMQWLAPNCNICLAEIEGAGPSGEEYLWSQIYVGEYHDGLAASVREFDVEDEDAAFAYAESLVAQRSRRLVVSNRASENTEAGWRAMRAHDVDTLVEGYSDRFVYDDRRLLSGDPVTDRAGLRAAFERVFEQLTVFEGHTLAVRGERLVLRWSRWSDDDGNQTAGLFVFELGDDGRTVYAGRFDEDDFWGAYRELEHRYYAGEGAAYATSGLAAADWVIAISNADLEAVRRVSHPDFRWIATPSALKDAERTVDDMFRWMQERARQVFSQRHWVPVLHWLSPNCAVGLGEITAIGDDGEKYDWTFIYVAECRAGLLVTAREFDDESSAFAYAEGLVARQPTRLTLSNSASRVADAVFDAMRANDADTAIGLRSQDLIYDDRRRIAGALIGDIDRLGAGLTMVLGQYTHIENRTLAVRGERLWLGWSRWRDDAGNEAAHLHVIELGGDGLIANELFLDEDDFETAYTELERRYYAGEGKPYTWGAALIEMVLAENRGDLDSAFSVFLSPGLRIENRSRSVFPTRTAAELRRSVEELGAMVTSYRVWSPAYCWLSNNWVVARHEREAVERDGQTFSWSRLYVGEIRDGLFTSLCEFDVDDEDAAFAYAEERMRAASSRLAVKNRASEVGQRVPRAVFDEQDLDTAVALFSDQFVYEDRRGLTGDPIVGKEALRAALDHLRRQYSRYDVRLLAVRGERLMLARRIWSDEAGNQSTVLLVLEIDGDSRILGHVAFDEDDFDSAYRELEDRYYSGEGREFALNARTSVSFLAAMDNLDIEAAQCVCLPTFRWFTPPSTLVTQERSLDEFFHWLRERADQVSSVKNFCSVIRWLTPECFVALGDVRAQGTDGEEYAWARIYVGELRDGLLVSMRQFEDEESAFAYAEDRVQVPTSRLAVANPASVTAESFLRAMQSHDRDAVLAVVSDDICFHDRRRLSGDPIRGKADARAAIDRIFGQYNNFEPRTLAVRGERLTLGWSRWSDDSGNETTHLHVIEIGDDGRIVNEARFDEDDFESAYQELERRYYSGEGAAFAESGNVAAEIVRAGTAGDLNEVFGELVAPGLRVESRSRTILPDRTAAELRYSIELFSAMVSSSQTWYSAVDWLSPNCVVARQERQAVGNDGKRYEWSRIYVGEFEHGVLTATCEFDVEFEDQAFAYAEERMRADTSRLAVSNRASETGSALIADLNAKDIDGAVDRYSEQLVYADRRRVGGALVTDFALLQPGVEAVCGQYSQFEGGPLAVRGDNLALGWILLSDERGNLTENLELLEVGDDGRIIFDATFDEDDFESAYRELEGRYYAGEGAEFAESGLAMAEYITVKNRGDLDTLFRDLSTPDVHIDSRSRSVLLDRSAAELRASLEELDRLVGSLREWLSAVQWISPRWFVTRYEREAVGQEDETYEWSRIVVGEIRHGRLASACQFELADEDAAFAYVEEQVRITGNPLAVTNRASELSGSLMRAMQAGEIDIALNHFSIEYVFDDHRRLSGDPIPGKVELRAAAERILQQFSRFERRVLAVRGERLSLAWSRWGDAAGNETSYLHVYELGDDDLIARDIRFDENDFDGAYRELEARYYAGEGAEFTEYGEFNTDYVMTMNRGDFDTMFNNLTSPDLHFENQSRSVFPDRSAGELRANFEDLYAMLASVRSWFSVIHWLSPTAYVGRLEREGLGHDGEHYAWSFILVNQYREGRLASICEFDAEDDAAALAYAEELARQT